MKRSVSRRFLIYAAVAAILWLASSSSSYAYTVTASAYSKTETTGLLGWWKLDEGAGTSVLDSSGSGYNGTCTNGPVWSADKPAGLTSSAGSLFLDGVDDYVSAGSSVNLANRSWTISFWAKRASTGAAHFVIGQGTGGFVIGRTGWYSGYFNGNIDDVRVYDGALSAVDIAAVAVANPL